MTRCYAPSPTSPERVEMLRWEVLTIQQFRAIAEEIYARINARTDHDLEGWDMHYLPDPRLGGMRRMSPAEVWRAGSRQLQRLRPQAVASILLQDMGEEITVRGGKLVTRDGSVSGDVLRYDARMLTDGERYRTILNPYAPDTLWTFDAKGRFVAACPRITSVDRADLAAVQEACGRAAKAEAEALAPSAHATSRRPARRPPAHATTPPWSPVPPSPPRSAPRPACCARSAGRPTPCSRAPRRAPRSPSRSSPQAIPTTPTTLVQMTCSKNQTNNTPNA